MNSGFRESYKPSKMSFVNIVAKVVASNRSPVSCQNIHITLRKSALYELSKIYQLFTNNRNRCACMVELASTKNVPRDVIKSTVGRRIAQLFASNDQWSWRKNSNSQPAGLQPLKLRQNRLIFWWGCKRCSLSSKNCLPRQLSSNILAVV